MNVERGVTLANAIISFSCSDVLYGAMGALVIATVLWAVPSIAPSARYRLLFFGLCATMALSITTTIRSSFFISPVQPQLRQMLHERTALPWNRPRPLSSLQTASAEVKPRQRTVPPQHIVAMPLRTAMYALAGWLLVVGGSLVRLAFGLLGSLRLLQRAEPVSWSLEKAVRDKATGHLHRRFSVFVTDDCAVPLAIGLFASAVLIPRQMFATFSRSDVEQIVLHEVAHLQRRDDLGYLFQLVSRALSLLSPGVYWMCARMELEREMACDRWAIHFGGSARRYAWCLAKMARCVGDSTPVPAALRAPSTTLRRIRELMVPSDRRPRSLSAAVPIAAFVAIVAFLRLNPLPAIAIQSPQKAAAMSSGGYITELRRLGLQNLSPSDFVDLKITGVRPAYVRAMRAIGIQTNAKDLMYLFAAGATPSYVARVHRVIPGATASDIALLADVRVPLAYVSGVVTAKPSAANAADVVRFHDLGITIQFLKSLSAMGYDNLVPEQVIAFQTVGVDASFIRHANGIAATRLSAEDLVRQKYAAK